MIGLDNYNYYIVAYKPGEEEAFISPLNCANFETSVTVFGDYPTTKIAGELSRVRRVEIEKRIHLEVEDVLKLLEEELLEEECLNS